jgi:hypothetical protein
LQILRRGHCDQSAWRSDADGGTTVAFSNGQEEAMYYGIGGTILIILLVLFLLGRI